MNALRDHANVWRSAAADFAALAHELDELDDSVWSLPTDCPTWSVGDLVAHAAAIESELAGDEPLRITIDKQAAHIKNGAGSYTERGVAARRGRSRDDVVDEYDDAIRRRTAQLDAEPLDDPTATPPRTPGGVEWDWETLMSRRALDLWIHEQDIRRAVGKPGGLDTAGASHTQATFVSVLPYVVAKRCGAPTGTTVVVDVTGPVSGLYAVEVDDFGRGRAVETPPEQPSARLTLDTESFTILGAGRRDASTLPIRISGDADLSECVLTHLAVTI